MSIWLNWGHSLGWQTTFRKLSRIMAQREVRYMLETDLRTCQNLSVWRTKLMGNQELKWKRFSRRIFYLRADVTGQSLLIKTLISNLIVKTPKYSGQTENGAGMPALFFGIWKRVYFCAIGLFATAARRILEDTFLKFELGKFNSRYFAMTNHSITFGRIDSETAQFADLVVPLNLKDARQNVESVGCSRPATNIWRLGRATKHEFTRCRFLVVSNKVKW